LIWGCKIKFQADLFLIFDLPYTFPTASPLTRLFPPCLFPRCLVPPYLRPYLFRRRGFRPHLLGRTRILSLTRQIANKAKGTLFFFSFAVLSTLTASAQQNAPISPATERASLKLARVGIIYAAPKGWSVEDVPQIDGVLMLAPDTYKKFRSRIVLQLDNPPSFAHIQPSIAKVQADNQYTEHRQELLRHPNGYALGVLEFSQTLGGISLRELRAVVQLGVTARMQISVTGPKELWDENKAALEQLLASLRART
jgi:hypothetical protein